ncbi:hypothetical protein CASFOL_008105 [Castilleja foliolosa]|uniref:Late embryogenesis abundant protein LEA-2 subgroup domain-containing protein n=1 Tax=Castilleja foliolosa TaxID=1961234 RepID=A0ABD3DZZ5_9LAMI
MDKRCMLLVTTHFNPKALNNRTIPRNFGSPPTSTAMYAPPPPYVVLNDGSQKGTALPPPPQRQLPMYNSHYKKPKSSGAVKGCLMCICCFYCFLFILVIVLASTAFYLYAINKPQIPSYKVENFEVKAFDLMPDFSLKTEFLVTVKADNPNNHIGFIYGEDSFVGVYYNDNDLCHGKLPSFHQGHKNTTYMKIYLAGKSEFGSGLQEALAESRKKKKVPLLVRVQAPIRVVVGELPMRQFMVFVNVYLIVDSLAPNKKTHILSSSTTFDYKL